MALCKTQVNRSLLFQFFCEEGWQDYHQREMDGYQYQHHFGQKNNCNDNCNDFSDFNEITAHLDKLIMLYFGQLTNKMI